MPRKSEKSRLDPYLPRLGKVPDEEIAEAVGLSRSTVAKHRRALNIPAYEGYKFAPGQPPGTRRLADEVPAPEPVKAEEPTGGRVSKLERYSHLLGSVPDEEVARMAGVTRPAVVQYRRRHGIPSVVKRREDDPVEVSVPAPAPAAAPASPAPPRSELPSPAAPAPAAPAPAAPAPAAPAPAAPAPVAAPSQPAPSAQPAPASAVPSAHSRAWRLKVDGRELVVVADTILGALRLAESRGLDVTEASLLGDALA